MAKTKTPIVSDQRKHDHPDLVKSDSPSYQPGLAGRRAEDAAARRRKSAKAAT